MNRRESTVTNELLSRFVNGDQKALDRLLDMHRTYLRKLVDLRMDDELRRRADPSDVVQEAQLVVSRNIEKYLKTRPATFRIWVRGVALERLIDLRRRHFAKKRSVRREIQISNASSMALAKHLIDGRPSQVLQRKELAEQIRQIIMELRPLDREVLLLRHVEELTNVETAEVLSVDPETARKRLGRALVRLTQKLADEGIELQS